jgi:uncharacterized protein (DUF433 family)
VAKWREHITISPAVCHGGACIGGTRVTVSLILGNPAAGVPHAEILRSYPALAYAAELAREGAVELPLEHTV